MVLKYFYYVEKGKGYRESERERVCTVKIYTNFSLLVTEIFVERRAWMVEVSV